jgi:hypothetical protein
MTPSEPRLRGLAWICRRDPRRRPLMLPVLAGSMLCVSSAALAQTSDAPVKRVVPPADATIEGPAPLLREGGLLLEVPGRIERNQDLGVHVYRPDPERTGGIRRELILLPSRGLDDLARIEEVRERLEQDPMAGVFEVSGRVLVYQGRNFLLPESIVPVVDVETAPNETEVTNAAESVDEDDIADDLESRLEARIGAVPRSLDLEEAAPATAAPVRPGTRFVDRRGHLSRDPESGVWRFVPSGDAPGVGGIVLLPCLELQRLERSSRQRDVSEPLLVSGLVTAYRGRNYLLPSAVKAAVEGRGIGP